MYLPGLLACVCLSTVLMSSVIPLKVLQSDELMSRGIMEARDVMAPS